MQFLFRYCYVGLPTARIVDGQRPISIFGLLAENLPNRIG